MCNSLSLIPESVSAFNRDFLQLQSNNLRGNGSRICEAPWNSHHEKNDIRDTVNILGKGQIGEGNLRYKMKVKPESLQDF